MTAKSVLVRPQGLRPGARASTCSPSCYATAGGSMWRRFLQTHFLPKKNQIIDRNWSKVIFYFLRKSESAKGIVLCNLALNINQMQMQ